MSWCKPENEVPLGALESRTILAAERNHEVIFQRAGGGFAHLVAGFSIRHTFWQTGIPTALTRIIPGQR